MPLRVAALAAKCTVKRKESKLYVHERVTPTSKTSTTNIPYSGVLNEYYKKTYSFETKLSNAKNENPGAEAANSSTRARCRLIFRQLFSVYRRSLPKWKLSLVFRL